MECKGTENQLFTCAFKNWGVTDCSHKEDVGVVCETASTYLNSYKAKASFFEHIMTFNTEKAK